MRLYRWRLMLLARRKKYKDLSLDFQYQVTGPLASRSILIKAQVSAAIQAEKIFNSKTNIES